MSGWSKIHLKMRVVPTGDRIISAFFTSSAVIEQNDRVLTSCHQRPRRQREREKLQGGNPYETLPELLDMV